MTVEKKKRKALMVSALTIECEMLCELVIGNHLPMQKFENMLLSTSSVVTSPVISPM